MTRIGVISMLALVLALPAQAEPTPTPSAVNWGAVLKALGGMLNQWRLSPFPRATNTAVPTRTPTVGSPTVPPTRTLTPSRTASATRTATWTRTPSVTATASSTATLTRTASVTRTPTETRPPTATRTASLTPSPVPTSTPLPTTSADGQIAFDVAEGLPPEQKLASAYIVFPYLVTSTSRETRIELFNMSDHAIQLQCFYVRKSDCLEVGFFVSLTPQQPLSWLVSEGASNPLTFSAVPPFNPATTSDFGELKCAVDSPLPDVNLHNALQGRAITFDKVTGETVAYGAIGFQKLSPGSFSGVIDLDGFTYDACPDRLHFQVLTRKTGVPSSEMIIAPCAQDLLTQTPTESTVQLAIVNEFEQVFSSSFRFKCLSSLSFSSLITLSNSTLGSETAHVVVRGVSTPLVGLVVDRFLGDNAALHTTANEPFLEGARSATVIFP